MSRWRRYDPPPPDRPSLHEAVTLEEYRRWSETADRNLTDRPVSQHAPRIVIEGKGTFSQTPPRKNHN